MPRKFILASVEHDSSGDCYTGILLPDKTVRDVIRAVREAEYPFLALREGFFEKRISGTRAAQLEQSAECMYAVDITLLPAEMEISIYFTGGASEFYRNDRNSSIITFNYPYRDGQIH